MLFTFYKICTSSAKYRTDPVYITSIPPPFPSTARIAIRKHSVFNVHRYVVVLHSSARAHRDPREVEHQRYDPTDHVTIPRRMAAVRNPVSSLGRPKVTMRPW